MKKVLITGGAGYIGSMLSTKLVEQGYDVTVVDMLKYSKNSLEHLYFYKNFKLIKKDIRNKKFIKKIINRFDYIIPLAALVGAPLCEKNKKVAIETNLDAIDYLISKLKKKQKLIFMNSNSGYGIGLKNKFCDENSPLKPISLYGKTKTEAEKKAMDFNNTICFRLATVFGFSYRMRTDLLVNNFVYESINKSKLVLFEPNFRRNFIHVRDVADGIIFAMKNFQKLRGNVYNLGLSSANITKLQLAKKIKKFHSSLVIKIKNNKKDPDKRDYFVSNKKIEKAGFFGSTTLETGINEMITIFKNSKIKYNNNY